MTKQFDTRAVHDGQEPDPSTGAVTVPIYQTSTYVQEAASSRRPDMRKQSPGRWRPSGVAGSARAAVCEGMAATTRHAPADPVLAVFGGDVTAAPSFRVYQPRARLRTSRQAVQQRAETTCSARMLWLESPTNPPLNVLDIACERRGSSTLAELASSSDSSPMRTAPDAASRPTTKAGFPIATPRPTAATPTWSRASPPQATPGWRSGWPSFRTRWARWRGRSTPGWCCAA